MLEQLASMTWKNPIFMLVLFSVIWYLPGLILRRRKLIVDKRKADEIRSKRISALYPKGSHK